MTPDFSTRAQRPSVRLLDAMALAIGAALLAYAGTAAWRATRAKSEAEEAVLKLRRESAAAEQRLREITGRSSERDELTFARATLTLSVPPARVLAEIERCLPTGVRLDGVTLKYKNAVRLEMRVVARSPQRYDRFLERLESSRRFSDLAFGAERRTREMMTNVVRARFIPGDEE
jgi:Tfp pilus assembly protein PilN